MSFTRASANNDLEGIIHSQNLNKVVNIDSLYQRAARNLLSKIDPRGTVRIVQIANAVHDEIFDYTAPTDLKGNKIIDIRPQVNRQVKDNLSQRFARNFDHRKQRRTFQVRDNSGVKSIRISQSVSLAPLTLHEMNDITENGTWAVDGTDASNITRDTLNRMSGSASLNFDMLGATTTGYIENTDMNSVDLTDHDEQSEIFVRVYLPDASTITNVILFWGSSSVNYWSATVTAPHDQASFKDGWNILKFSWNGATESVAGGVDPSAINYLRVTFTYDGVADTDFRVDKISSSLGEIYEIEYYSKYLFQSTGGTWKETTTEDTDIVNLDTDGYNLFLFECAFLIAQQMQGEDAGFDRSYFKEELYGDGRTKVGLYATYKGEHPSEVIRPRTSYWNPRTYR